MKNIHLQLWITCITKSALFAAFNTLDSPPSMDGKNWAAGHCRWGLHYHFVQRQLNVTRRPRLGELFSVKFKVNNYINYQYRYFFYFIFIFFFTVKHLCIYIFTWLHFSWNVALPWYHRLIHRGSILNLTAWLVNIYIIIHCIDTV